jgi:hypothetical protein
MMSLLGSKSTKAPAPEAKRGVVVEKPKANIYTVMLALSLTAVLVGCLMLYLELNAYNFEMGPR